MSDPFQPLATLFDLSGKVAVVTGGSRGLGLQIAEALGEFGATVILTARKPTELAEAVAHLAALGIAADCFAADLGREDGVAALVAWLEAEYGRVDILVNNAGTSWGAATTNHPIEAWNKVMSLNLTAPFLLTQAIGRKWMVPCRYGRILNIASTEGIQGHHASLGSMIAYSSSKGGLVNFTRALAAEWGQYGITVNALAPGFFPSRLTQGILPRIEPAIIAGTPLGKLGGPGDLKGAALLFASAAGGHVTGQVLAIDGGYTII
jgi:gluconate 5-dehydrogenase